MSTDQRYDPLDRKQWYGFHDHGSAEKAGGERGTMTKPSILVIEDEAIVASDIRETLISLGYMVPGIAKTAKEPLNWPGRPGLTSY
jgi:hypothetical protein